MSDTKPRMKDVLLVEDNPGDVRLTEEVFRESGLCKNLHVVGDGIEAISYLRKEKGFADAPKPDLILLDLNLPKKDGREVLAEIKADKILKTIPVVILTTSQSEQDISRSYELYANCYIAKPIDLENFAEVVNAIENFWLKVVKLPT